MNKKLTEIINSKLITDVSGKWVSKENCLEISQFIIEECIKTVERTEKNHAYTTYDVSMVEGTIQRSVKSIKNYFGLDNR